MVPCILLRSNQTIFLQIALALQARAILLAFEKFTRAYLFQIALEIMWLLIQTEKGHHGRNIIHLMSGPEGNS